MVLNGWAITFILLYDTLFWIFQFGKGVTKVFFFFFCLLFVINTKQPEGLGLGRVWNHKCSVYYMLSSHRRAAKADQHQNSSAPHANCTLSHSSCVFLALKLKILIFELLISPIKGNNVLK